VITKFTLFTAMALIATAAHAGPIKNSQTLLGGSLVRAGVSGQAPLSDSQLRELCEQGFSKAYFLYRNIAPKTVNCGGNRSITYKSQSWINFEPILDDINRDLTSRSGHVFIHCHNGAHASGAVAAIALRQFCGMSGEQAMAYWSRTNTYGTPPGIGSIQRRVHGFSPVGGMTRSPNCP